VLGLSSRATGQLLLDSSKLIINIQVDLVQKLDNYKNIGSLLQKLHAKQYKV
jgi:hypothetical protein